MTVGVFPAYENMSPHVAEGDRKRSAGGSDGKQRKCGYAAALDQAVDEMVFNAA